MSIESSENKTHPWSGKSAKDAENLYAVTYPAIHSFHQQFRAGLIKRADQGKYFWELRSCAYWQEFEQPKIIVPAITDKVNYAPDKNKFYTNNKCSIFIPPSIAIAVVACNSPISMWLVRQTFATKQGGFFDFEPRYSSTIPVPAVTLTDQAELETLVQRILENPNTGDIAAKEAEINERVYRLFGLTSEEIKLIEAD